MGVVDREQIRNRVGRPFAAPGKLRVGDRHSFDLQVLVAHAALILDQGPQAPLHSAHRVGSRAEDEARELQMIQVPELCPCRQESVVRLRLPEVDTDFIHEEGGAENVAAGGVHENLGLIHPGAIGTRERPHLGL